MAGRSDWVHIYHSVLPVLSLHQVRLRPYCTFVLAILRIGALSTLQTQQLALLIDPPC